MGANQSVSVRKPSRQLRVVLAHAMPEFLQVFSLVLANESDLQLVGTAGDESTALRQIALLQPDLLVCCMRVDDLKDFVRQARDMAPGIRIVMVDVYEKREAEELVRSSGADAFVAAQKVPMELGKTIHLLSPS